MRRIYSTLFLVVIIMSGVCTVTAQANVLGFATTAFSDDEISAIISSISLESSTVDSAKAGIYCFDVRQDGVYALAFGMGANSRISVYDSDSTFLYGYAFNSNGVYRIAFQEDSIAIYFLRGNVIVTFDPAGVCIDVQKVMSTKQNDLHVDELLDRTHKNIAAKEYSMERDFEIGDAYSRFVVVNELGERTILYDASAEHEVGQFLLLASLIVFFALVILGVWKKHVK